VRPTKTDWLLFRPERFTLNVVASNKFQFPINTSVHTSDCQTFERRFRSASFDRATKLETIFPDAWLDHFEAKFDALIIHEASPYLDS
jgi:hypothetical protein